jgi:O-antigen/teichoic acid export membrane protein
VNVFLFRIVAQHYNHEEFNLYSLIRRLTAFINPLLIFGLGVVLPREIGNHNLVNNEQTTIKVEKLLIISTLIVLIIYILFYSLVLILINANNEIITKSVYSLIINNKLLFDGFSIYLLGLVLLTLASAFYRGKYEIRKANYNNIFGLGIIPLITFYFVDSLGKAFMYSGFLMISYFLFTLKKNINSSSIRLELKTLFSLFKKGAERVPGDISLYLLLLIPTYLVGLNTENKLESIGSVSFGLSLLAISQIFISPFTFMSLVRNVKDFKTDKQKVKNELALAIYVVTIMSVLLTFFSYFFCNTLVDAILGVGVIKDYTYIKIILISIPGFNAYLILRGTIDAKFSRAFNTYNILISLFVFLILSFFFRGNFAYQLNSFVFSIYLLASLSSYRVFKIFS